MFFPLNYYTTAKSICKQAKWKILLKKRKASAFLFLKDFMEILVCVLFLFFLCAVFGLTGRATASAAAVTAAARLALLFADNRVYNNSEHKCDRKYDNQNFIPLHYLSSEIAASARIVSPVSASFFASGWRLFQRTIPTAAATMSARTMNAVHHQLPTT